MSSFLGMDVAAVRQLSSQMNQAASDIQQHANTINNALHSAQWVGTDANNFRNDWQSHYQNLNTVVSALNDAAQAASSNADQQEQASS